MRFSRREPVLELQRIYQFPSLQSERKTERILPVKQQFIEEEASETIATANNAEYK